MFKPYQIVIFVPPKGYEGHGYPFKSGESLLFLSEIVQMPGHCAVVNRSGRVYWGYHTDNFREPLEEEI
jgi:hypothetical protein